MRYLCGSKPWLRPHAQAKDRMLNHDALSQLKSLKQKMEAEKEYADAVVKGSPGRYGFATLADGREIFVSPDEMLRVFPEDRVRVCIKPGKGDKPIAAVERLLESPTREFIGRCVRKGKALFVQPDLTYLNRWLFLPPHARNGVREGDYVRAAVLRHPFKDGKPQAKILAVLGRDDSPGIEALYSAHKYQLPLGWSKEAQSEVEQRLAGGPQNSGTRTDLTGLKFVTIDAAKTLDIDDALYAETTADGWVLYVGIADPTALIDPTSPLGREIATRGATTYFHGEVLAMLPEVLSQQACALVEGEDRPALVCRIRIGNAGEIRDYEFIEAMICSRGKLSYFGVDRYLNGSGDDLMTHAIPLEPLYQLYRALRERREREHLVMEDRREYRWIMDERRRIDHIESYDKLLSQRLVEECMIAANRCAADLLRRHDATGPYVQHLGFREDRAEDLSRLLETFAPQFLDRDLSDPQHYRDLMLTLSTDDRGLPLRAMASRLLRRAQLQTGPGPHLGMGLDCYTTCTSPLRKFTDFLVHWQIKSLLHGQGGTRVNDEMLEALSERLGRTRAAMQEADRWLLCEYLSRLEATDPGRSYPARILHMNSSGFTVRLDDNGIEGTVDLRPDQEKFSFDRWRVTLTSTTRRFQLEQAVVVQVEAIDTEQRSIGFKLTADCGLKAPVAALQAPPVTIS